MADITQTSMGTADLLKRMREHGSAIDLMRRGRQEQRSLSAILEAEQPSEKGDSLDAFGRLMKEANVISRTIHSEGIYSDSYEDFEDRAGRALFVEWSWRAYHRAQTTPTMHTGQRDVAISSDALPGSVTLPFSMDLELRADDFQPAVPLSEILAADRGVDSNNVQGVYLIEPSAAAKRLVRVGETAEIPRTTIRLGERNITLYKFGRALEMSYEAIRRERLDRIARMIQLMAVQAEIDKLAAVIDVLVNGDGNTSTTPTSYNLTTLDTDADAGTLTLKGWLAFLGKFKNPYIATHALAQEAIALQIKLLNAGSANLPTGAVLVNGGASLAPSIRPINRTLSPVIGLGETDDAPADKIVAIDRRVAVERLFEIGADIQENETYVSRQTQAVFFTEVEGYQVGSGNANGTKILNVAA